MNFDNIKQFLQEQTISNTGLNHIKQSIYQFYLYKKFDSVSTPAMEFGTIFHKALLQPDKFKQEYILTPPELIGLDMRLKENKTKIQEFEEQTNGLTVLNAEQTCIIESNLKALQDIPILQELLNLDNAIIEKNIQFHYINNFLYNSFIDLHYIDKNGEINLIDIKTTANTDDTAALSKSIETYSYYRQLAFYRLALQSIYPDAKINCYLVFFPKKEPFLPIPLQISNDYLDYGLHCIHELINKLQTWLDKPNTIDFFNTITMPKWLNY